MFYKVYKKFVYHRPNGVSFLIANQYSSKYFQFFFITHLELFLYLCFLVSTCNNKYTYSHTCTHIHTHPHTYTLTSTDTHIYTQPHNLTDLFLYYLFGLCECGSVFITYILSGSRGRMIQHAIVVCVSRYSILLGG